MRLARVVDDHRQQKQVIVRHVERALDRQTPFAPKITLVAGLGARRHDGHEEIALAYLFADLLIPRIAPAQLAFVQPDVDPELGERIADRARRLAVFGCVAEEYRCRQVRAPEA